MTRSFQAAALFDFGWSAAARWPTHGRGGRGGRGAGKKCLNILDTPDKTSGSGDAKRRRNAVWSPFQVVIDALAAFLKYRCDF